MRVAAALLASLSLLLASPATRADPPGRGVDVQVVLNAYQGLVEEHLAGVLHSVRVIAASGDARSGNWEQVRPMLERLGGDLDTDATVWFAMPDGSYYATEAKGLTGQNLRDRTYFPRLMDGHDIVGDLVVSKSTGHRSVIVATPVKADGKVVAAVGVSIRLRRISAMVERFTGLPANMYFYSLTADALTSTHRRIDRLFMHPTDIGDESIGPGFAASLARERGRLDYVLDGKRIGAIFQKSEALGWHFFIAREAGGRMAPPSTR